MKPDGTVQDETCTSKSQVERVSWDQVRRHGSGVTRKIKLTEFLISLNVPTGQTSKEESGVKSMKTTVITRTEKTGLTKQFKKKIFL